MTTDFSRARTAPCGAFPALAALLAGGLLVGCGGADSPAEIAAQACDAQVRTQSGGNPYQLDLAALAASATDAGDGLQLLTAPVVVNAGLATESPQTLECTVRIADGAAPEVTHLRFIW
ncbi:MAG TPA: hypothetical protein DCM32_06065 [Xanthomonadaceae bacterium]|jgi:hypothetical protein|nr:hypothetical protein [Xanthomonadaceae bacterium]